MKKSAIDKPKIRFSSGLGRTLAISFLLFALVPMTLVSVISYMRAHDSMRQEIRKGLETAAALKTRQISVYFDNMLDQLRYQSETEANAKLLEELITAFAASGQSLGDFVKSYKWATIVDRLAGDIKTFRTSFNYHDIFLISKNGDILFTVAGEDDLGMNLFTGKLGSGKFAAASKRTLETGKLSFSDYERFAPSGDLVSGFITAAVVNEDGERIGIMAFQFSIAAINRIMRSEWKLGKSAEIYLIGPDNTLRSELFLDKDKALLSEEIGTEQTIGLQQGRREKTDSEKIEQEALVYKGPHGKPVLGLHKEFGIENIEFAVIAEIEEKEAFAPVSGLRRIMLLMIGVTVAVVVLFVVIMVRRTVRPILALSSGAARVAKGDLDTKVDVRSKNEVGRLAENFNTMVGSLRRAEEDTKRQERVSAVINRVIRESFSFETEEDVASVCLREAEELTASKFGWIGEINEAGLMDTIAISSPGWDACNIIVSDAKNFIKNMPIRGIDRSTLKEGRARIVNADKMEDHPDRIGLPPGHPSITAFLGVPFQRGDKTVGMIALANKEGGYTQDDQNAIEKLSVAFYEALIRKRAEIELQRQNALRGSQGGLSDVMRGGQEIDELCRNIITYLCKHFGAQTGLIYVNGSDSLKLTASYAHKRRKHLAVEYKPGEGLVGQAALEKEEIVLSDVPADYITIESGLGQTVPRNVYVKPIIYNDEVKAVIELGTLDTFTDSQSQFLNMVAENIGVAIESAQSRTHLAKALEASQALSEELQTQQEELRVTNEELEEQARRLKVSEEQLQTQQEELKVTNEELTEQTSMLKKSEEKLQTQQEELKVTNEELQEKTESLERQKRAVEQTNTELEQTRQEIEQKAEELALASKYKSEFLANMSHELRTPLNSLLLLAHGLAENKEGNLTDEQVESAGIIHGSGNDLLNLINEILDLSKIESGRMEIQLRSVRIADLADGVRSSFGHMAEEKGLSLEVVLEENAPAEIRSDRQRVEQIIRNLVSNALKFTESGGTTVTFGRPAQRANLSRSGLDANECLSIAVKDTGIGITPEKQKIIFEAFQQADGGTSRKYGGTGLGLSISREIARLLGGEIQLESTPGSGSVFTLFLPTKEVQTGISDIEPCKEKKEDPPSAPSVPKPEHVPSRQPERISETVQSSIPDDRDNIEDSDRVMLVIEDDLKFARLLLDKVREMGFKCIAAPTGEEGLELAVQCSLNGILLDIGLPGMDGWTVLSALKDDTRTRHIPVHVVSAYESSADSVRKGAIGHVTKPLTREELEEAVHRIEEVMTNGVKRVLVVEDDPVVRRHIVELIGDNEVEIDEAEDGRQAIEAIRSTQYGCVILDLGLPDIDGGDLLNRLQSERPELPPIIIHTAMELTPEQHMSIAEFADSIVIKDVRSMDRLLDEVSLFLHQMVGRMPERKKQVIRSLHESDGLLKEKKVLIVDDDMRTAFALSKLLTDRGLKPVKAENGERALARLAEEPDVDIVLMDIMMPVMDGYEAMRKIREQSKFRDLPIIALTAKAMDKDREECLAAGASDYMAKPVDQDRLISMLRVWLYR